MYHSTRQNHSSENTIAIANITPTILCPISTPLTIQQARLCVDDTPGCQRNAMLAKASQQFLDRCFLGLDDLRSALFEPVQVSGLTPALIAKSRWFKPVNDRAAISSRPVIFMATA
jgi:hypothetical protein